MFFLSSRTGRFKAEPPAPLGDTPPATLAYKRPSTPPVEGVSYGHTETRTADPRHKGRLFQTKEAISPMPDSRQATRSPKGSECQCPACIRFFTSPSGFDFHQWWRGRGDKAALVCLDPAAIGMVDRARAAGETWGFPDRETGKGGAVALRNALIDRLSRQEGPKSGSDAPSQP